MKAVRFEIKLGADFIKLMVSGGLGGMPEHEHPSWTEFSPMRSKPRSTPPTATITALQSTPWEKVRS
jgi:hypothetical protein